MSKNLKNLALENNSELQYYNICDLNDFSIKSSTNSLSTNNQKTGNLLNIKKCPKIDLNMSNINILKSKNQSSEELFFSIKLFNDLEQYNVSVELTKRYLKIKNYILDTEYIEQKVGLESFQHYINKYMISWRNLNTYLEYFVNKGIDTIQSVLSINKNQSDLTQQNVSKNECNISNIGGPNVKKENKNEYTPVSKNTNTCTNTNFTPKSQDLNNINNVSNILDKDKFKLESSIDFDKTGDDSILSDQNLNNFKCTIYEKIYEYEEILQKKCPELIAEIDKLIDRSTDGKSLIYYELIKANILAIYCEVVKDEEFNQIVDECERLYQNCYEKSFFVIKNNDYLYLNIALNFASFQSDILDNNIAAYNTSNSAYLRAKQEDLDNISNEFINNMDLLAKKLIIWKVDLF